MTKAAPLTAEEVASAEHALRIIFPREYREFLLTVSAGGTKVRRLLHTTNGWCWEGDRETVRQALSSPFPDQARVFASRMAHSEREPSFEDDHEAWQAWDAEPQEEPTAGAICLSDHGCGFYTLLVVTGPHRGTMWFDQRATSERIIPIPSVTGAPMTFAEWYATPESTWLPLVS